MGCDKMYDDSFRARYNLAPVAISTNDTFGTTPNHIHREIEMLYIVSGSSKIFIADKVFTAHGGDLFFVNPMEVHSIVVNKKGGAYIHHCICFDTSIIADKGIAKSLTDGNISIKNHFPLGQPLTDELIKHFLTLFYAVKTGSKTIVFDANICVSQILSTLIKEDKLIKNTLPEKKAAFSKRVIDYLNEHYHEDISSKSVATDLFYTQSYFCRAFKVNFGIPFSSYLNMYRILSAKEKLKDKNKKIIDIALECGFNNSTYFTRCFTKSVGISPLKYQKSQYSSEIM